MVFSSVVFIFVFLPIVFLLNYFFKEKYSNTLLLVASLIFYAWGEPILVVLMFFSIIFNWIIGIAIEKCNDSKRIIPLIVGVACNLAILGYYKYIGFVIEIVNLAIGRNVFTQPEIELPIGISFFTFQAISYIVDVYRRDTKASSQLTNVALYISFFPQLIAGPIVKYREINEQIECRHVRWENIAIGFKQFIYGLSKKVLISNILGECADTIYAMNINAIDSKTAWIAALSYSFQIYYDFSGYSDMAIGLGKMFGFDIPENFRYPYISKSITEFWRRWHISLGSWFREYLYIPLGGNKKGKTRTYINLFIVFLFTGLWHGADFAFIIWGLYHGFFSIIERLGLKKFLEKQKLLSILYCFIVVNFGWIIFRTESTVTSIRMLSRMIMPWKYVDLCVPSWEYMDLRTVFVGIVAILGAGMIQSIIPDSIKKLWKDSVIEALYCVFVLILSLASIVSNTYNPFIYFQF